MVDRVKVKASPLQKLRESLRIDRDDLDTALEEQPELYFHVAQAAATSVAEADAALLDRDQVIAKNSKEIREGFLNSGEKATEARIQEEITLCPEVQRMRRARVAAGEEAGNWQALKDSYHQRSFMLRELVALYIAQRHDSAMAGGSAEARGRVADDRHEAASDLRRKRRTSGE